MAEHHVRRWEREKKKSLPLFCVFLSGMMFCLLIPFVSGRHAQPHSYTCHRAVFILIIVLRIDVVLSPSRHSVFIPLSVSFGLVSPYGRLIFQYTTHVPFKRCADG